VFFFFFFGIEHELDLVAQQLHNTLVCYQ